MVGTSARSPCGLVVVWILGLASTLAGGCAGDRPSSESALPPSASPSPTSLAVDRRSYDPPLQFDQSVAVPLPVGPREWGPDPGFPVALHNGTAYVGVHGGLRAVDTRNGNLLWAVDSKHPATPGSQPLAPLVQTAGDRPVVVAAFNVTIPGRGTTAARRAVELMAVDGATGTPVWTWQVDVAATLVAADERSAVLTAGLGFADPDEHTTYLIDLGDGRIRWKRARFRAAALTGDTVVGVDGEVAENPSMQELTALAVSDGRQRWTAARRSGGLTAQPAGRLLVVSGADYHSGNPFLVLLDDRTGAVRGRLRVGQFATSPTCRDDGVSVVVCSFIGNEVVAFDTASARKLWSLPDRSANRVAVRVTAAWHGAVYGMTDNGPVVLDARTGADRHDAPGIAPEVVDGYVGVARSQDGLASAYPAVG